MASRDIVIIAHNIRSLWNVGSFFRCADVFGVSHVHLTGYTACPPRKEITKTALGAEEWIAWSYEQDPLAVIHKRKEQGYDIVALELTQTSQPIGEFVATKPLCLILGHEVLGVSVELLAASDAVVHIPMFGRKSSLNVSVACGVALYELSKK